MSECGGEEGVDVVHLFMLLTVQCFVSVLLLINKPKHAWRIRQYDWVAGLGGSNIIRIKN